MGTYGYFDDDAREYVITNPKTPVKWINYVGTLAFGGFVDHTGGVLLCKGDPALNRITKYIPQLPDGDFKGTTLYVRIVDDTGYRSFSPFFAPTLDSYDRYECHVGLGYSRFVTEFYGIRTEVTVLIPPWGEQLLQDICITNLRDAPLVLDVIPVVEYTHPDALKQFTNADWVPQTMTSRVVSEDAGFKTLIEYPFMLRDISVNYFTSNHPVASFETDRTRFLGRCGAWAAPQALQQPELGNYEAMRGDSIGALLHHLGMLQPGESRRLITQLGQAASFEAAQPGIERYRDPRQVDAALAEMADFWRDYLSRLQVQTPDAAMNAMLNVHNPRQVFITMNWSRYLSLYQLGLGARGIGFRDTSQDVMGVVSNAPDRARALIAKLLHVQRRDGSAMHQFNPLTMIASAGESSDLEDRPDFYGDDHLWIILATTQYLKETGDFTLLDEALPFYEKDNHEQPLESATVLEHLRRAIAFTRAHVGQHGLPLAGFADWNDTVNLRTGAESLFNAFLYGRALLEMIALSEHLGDVDATSAYHLCYEEMQARVEAGAWDGEWYARYFDREGNPIGSHTNTEGKIFTNAQSWSVISGFASPERAQLALDSVFRWLNTTRGIKLSTPGYDGFDPDKGGVTTYPPGAKENGGIFLHANPWVMIAETMLGRGDRAFAYYTQINPAAMNDDIDTYECEPYVYPQNILGDEHPQFGLARNSWLTGTASWMYQAATRYILGIRPTYEGLEIDPCIPSSWDGFTIRREFRGTVYDITVRNPDHVTKGVAAMWVDGEEHVTNVVPLLSPERNHRVLVMMGNPVDDAFR